jgi:hypothetical protein
MPVTQHHPQLAEGIGRQRVGQEENRFGPAPAPAANGRIGSPDQRREPVIHERGHPHRAVSRAAVLTGYGDPAIDAQVNERRQAAPTLRSQSPRSGNANRGRQRALRSPVQREDRDQRCRSERGHPDADSRVAGLRGL